MANKILILSADRNETQTLQLVLSQAKEQAFELVLLQSLVSGLAIVVEGKIDAVILDLALPDGNGLAAFNRLYACAGHIPILVLCPFDQEELAINCIHHGAQGYLLKGHFNSYLLAQGLRSIIARKELASAFYKEKIRAEIALNSIGDAVICTDLAGNIDYLNIAAEKLTLWDREQAHGRPFSEVFKIINGETRSIERNTVQLVLQQNKPIGLPPDTILIRRDGSEAAIEDSAAPINDMLGHQTGVVVVFHDVSVAQMMSKKMAFLAQHDFLTNLPNRLMLNDRIAQAITIAKRNHTRLAILFLDLDNFKHINDSLGHAIGDKLLQSVSLRLVGCVRDSDTVSRQGGDEFVILLAESDSEINTATIAGKILQVLSCPHCLPECELHITASMGISVYPSDGEDVETMIQSADIAMYHAKERGRNNFQFFRSDMNTRAAERQKIEAHLRMALERKEFVLYYQPQINLQTGKVTGAEALIRWMHKDMGMVMPDRFIPIAEDCGLIVPIGRWVLREACRQAHLWTEQGFDPVSISVNISAVEFRQKNFLQGVTNILRETGVDASQLELEITESVLMRDAQGSVAILQELKKMGVRLAVDDFGTGYFSLSYLEQFPLDVLKIDQSFVQDIPANDSHRIIISAVIGMGNSLQLRVIAEGIENQSQLNFLRSQHCQEGQGYFLSHPLTIDQFGHLLWREKQALKCV